MDTVFFRGNVMNDDDYSGVEEDDGLGVRQRCGSMFWRGGGPFGAGFFFMCVYYYFY